MHDVRFPHAGQAVLHPGPDERRRPALPPEPARRLQRAGDEVLRGRGDSRARAHAPALHRLQGPQARQHTPRRARPRQDIGPRARLRLLQEEAPRQCVSNCDFFFFSLIAKDLF